MKKPPTYANVNKNEPPDWMRLQVRDLDKNELIQGVVEVNAEEGWAVRYIMEPERRPVGEVWPTERITGRFALEWQEGYNPTNG
ncbi:hypothetical protein Bhz59_00035 [Stenotrophomonas phage vB_SmaS_Bhz59]